MQRRARTFTVVVAMSADSRDIATSIVTAGKWNSNAFGGAGLFVAKAVSSP
jgi:hypothetical protein